MNPGTYVAKLKMEFEDGTITKSEDMSFEIRRAVNNWKNGHNSERLIAKLNKTIHILKS